MPIKLHSVETLDSMTKPRVRFTRLIPWLLLQCVKCRRGFWC